ncbi:MAG TPA: LLM class flavin-dependent oxidoreductase [Pseudonocardia sp.]|jgi:alkanesulfonate monooxygenase SsuD/methylene tetrahydromethanopterin reductase-like flavin-dependent oxidoreductase (luciferase family)|nr:LLM class flavin-dependent oxidoreductase [Pseudonocardia sp.]
MPVDCGVLFGFRNPPFSNRPWTDVYRDELDLIVESERLGYGHAWLTEHHFVEDGYSPSLMTIAGAAAARTTAIRIGTFVVLLPLHDPITVAEDAATVDVISNGRFDLGMGAGYVPDEFAPRGIAHNSRARRMEEGLQIVRGLLDGESVSYDGKHNHLEDIKIMPPPVQKPFPIWVGARGEKAIDRAGRLGFHFASVGAGHHRDKYLASLENHGRKAEDFNILQLVMAYCADTHEKAWDDVADGFHHVLKYYHDWAVASGDITKDVEGQAVPTPEQFRKEQKGEFFGEPAFVGTPDEVLAGLQEYLKRSPGSHLVLYMAMPGADAKNTRRSMELFAKHVMPNL